MITKTIDALKKFNKVIIWGLKDDYFNSFYYIYKGFYDNLCSLDIQVIWVRDDVTSNSIISSNDLVIAVNIAAKYLETNREAYYCLHNFEEMEHIKSNKGKTLHLQVYTSACEDGTMQISDFRYYNKITRTLYQPWGTPLQPSKFLHPVYPNYSKFVFWVGSIWDNKRKQGNTDVIKSLVKILRSKHLIFLNPKHVPDWIGVVLVRLSRIAPTVAGSWQVEANYLPCRFFKNISYGQLGITNIPKIGETFGKDVVYSKDISILVNNSLSIQRDQYINIISKQQELIKDYTYVNNLYYIAKYVRNL